ncbi:MAG: TAXI family TRAP transporter solute-binding subunit [Rhodocyclaceae bacterium]
MNIRSITRPHTDRRTAVRRVATATIAAALLLGAGTAAAQQKLLIGTTSSSSSHYGYFVAVSQLLNSKVASIDTSVVETGATMDNLRRLERRQIDFGLVTTNVIHHANAGTGDFDGKPNQARLLWIYSIAPQIAVVRKDAGISSLAELSGKRFNTGLRGSATEKTSDSVFALLGISPDVVRGATGEIVDAVKDNRALGYVKSGAGLRIDASTREIATFTPLTALGIDDEQRALIAGRMPELSIVDVPADPSVGLPPFTTWGFGVGAAAGSELSEQVAYEIVKAVVEDSEAQAAAFGEVSGVDIAEMTVRYASSPLHPGAVRYFRERGLDVPDRLIAD